MTELDVPEAWKLIRRLIKKSVDVESGMNELVQYCAKQMPGDVWSQVATLDFRSDGRSLKTWLTGVLSAEPPPPTVKAFWFGLFLPADAQGNVRLRLYVSGSNSFDRSDETFDWASSPAYFPAGRYANSQVLKKLYDFSQQEILLCSALHEIIGFGFAAMTVAQICRQRPRIFLRAAKKRHLAIGFEAGDGFLLGAVTAQGFQPTARGEVDHLKPLKPTPSNAEFYIFQEPLPWSWRAEEIKSPTTGPHPFLGRKFEPIIDGWETEAAKGERRAPVDILYSHFGPPIIHGRIAKKLSVLAADSIQLIPVTVRGVSSETRKYMILNVVQELASLDHEATQFLSSSVAEPWIVKHVIKRSLASGQQIFRLAEDRNTIVISRIVKEMLEAERVSGVKLVPLETTD